jgi:hypothetical protein
VHESSDPACPTTVEGLVVSGANDVCGPPATAPPDVHAVTLALGAVLGVTFALALAGKLRATRPRVAVLVGMAALAALPGARALLVDRADAPLRAKETGAAIADLIGDIDSFVAHHHGCVAQVHDDCLACQPLLRFVLPQKSPCARGEARIDVSRGAFASTGHAQPCAIQGDALECGAPRL